MDVEAEKKKLEKIPGKFSPKAVRFRIALLLLLALYSSSCLRVDLSMAVVCMVKSPPKIIPPTSEVEKIADLSSEPTCEASIDGNDSDAAAGYKGDLEFSSEQVSFLLASTFYGGIITVWGAGILTEKFSKKYVLLLSVGSAAITAFLFPTLIKTHWILAIVERIFLGLGQGIAIPAVAAVASQWFPASEMASYAALYTSGNQIAAVTALPISSLLCASSYGWPMIFYTFGTLALIWAILWSIFGSSTPDGNKFISENEKSFLLREVINAKKSKKRSTDPVPYKSILTSAPFWACVASQVSFNFSAVLMSAYLPTYLKQILKIKLKNNGFVAMLPFLMQIITKNIAGNVGDALRKRKLLSNTMAVKIFQVTGNLGTATCFLILCYLIDCNNAGFGAIVLAMFGSFLSCGIPGFMTSILTIAPRFTASLISIGLFLGSIANAAAPSLVGFINKNGTREEWRIVWFVAIGLHIFSALIFGLFASGEVQEWAKVKEPEKQEQQKLESNEKALELEMESFE